MTVFLITLDPAMKMPIAVTQQMEQNAPTLFVDQLKVSSQKSKLFLTNFNNGILFSFKSDPDFVQTLFASLDLAFLKSSRNMTNLKY